MNQNMRPLGLERWYFQRVEVTSKSFHSGIDGTRTIEKFNCIVAFPSTEPHKETIKNYATWYHQIDMQSKDYHVFRLLSDVHWCAEALAIFYFREKNKPYLEADTDPYKYVLGPPQTDPVYESDDMAIWVEADETERVETERSVAIHLRDVIRSGGKISVETANMLIREKFGPKFRLDNEVLYAFSKIGGKYTKKYLRL